MSVQVIKNAKGDTMGLFDMDAWPCHTLGLKWLAEGDYYGGAVTYSERWQLPLAWVALLWGILRNWGQLELSEVVDVVPFCEL